MLYQAHQRCHESHTHLHWCHSNLWLLCLMCVVYILDITANSRIGDISPHQHLYGQTPNMSPAICF